jgi:pimeloyl-ACP methyl ester carboxylesterase
MPRMKNKTTITYHEIPGNSGKPISYKVHFNPSFKAQPIVIFAHGYKGFMDFGAWELIGNTMAESGICFVRFNFSHNGVTPKSLQEFEDLDAFGHNNFTRELDDYHAVIKSIFEWASSMPEVNEKDITLVGHSRGGAVSILTANESKKVSRLVTWAAVSDLAARMPVGKQLEKWRNEGVAYILNGRTGQQMPHYFQFYTDFMSHSKRFNVKYAMERLSIPILVIHGSNDETVPLSEGQNLALWGKDVRFSIIENADHSFGTFHPWSEPKLPPQMQKVVQKTMYFVLGE